jgi:two-component system OmpR family response regulator
MEEKLKIFFCEDDENLGMLLREYLQAKGYVTDLFSDGEAGYKGFTKGKYDLCVGCHDAKERWFHLGTRNSLYQS